MSNSVSRIRAGDEQFRGVFSRVWRVEATVDYASINSNATGYEEISVPGLDQSKDVVLGFNRNEDVSAHGTFEVAHVHDDAVHLAMHNVSGGSYNPPSATYLIVVGRMQP